MRSILKSITLPVSLISEISCPVNSLPDGAIKDGCKHRVGDICTYQCNSGYENVTEAIICNSNMRWTPYKPCRSRSKYLTIHCNLYYLRALPVLAIFRINFSTNFRRKIIIIIEVSDA